MKRYFLFLFFCIASYASADLITFLPADGINTGNQLSLAPVVSRATYKANDVTQKGYLWGIKGQYDLLAFNGPYLGFETYYMRGKLKSGAVESTYRDFLFEGKIGLTMGIPSSYYFTPYAGVGYENERNDYTTVPIEKIDYYYVSAGVLSNLYLSPQFTAGLNLKVKFPFTGDHKVKNESVDTSLSVSKKIQYVIEVPFTYWASSNVSFSAVPYYESKKYNNNIISENWNTTAKMHQWGLALKAVFAF
jgi:hypothetical protein